MHNQPKTDNSILKIFLEYVLALLIIVECNSNYIMSVATSGKNALIYKVLVLAILVVLTFIEFKNNHSKLRGLMRTRNLVISAMFIVFATVYCIFGVVPLHNNDGLRDYLFLFCILLPIFSLYFVLKLYSKDFLTLVKRYADIMVVISAISLVLYIFLNFFPHIIESDLTQIYWSSLGKYVRAYTNYYNLASTNSNINLFGLIIARNYGFFPEPLMFCIPLLISACYELFMQTKLSMVRIILLSLALFSTLSSLGICLLLVMIYVRLMVYLSGKKKTRAEVIVSIIAFGLVCTVVLRKAFSEMVFSESSFYYHAEDYALTFRAFLSKPIFGCGFGNEDYIKTFMSASRLADNPGFSNSIGLVLAEGGLVFGAICIAPYAYGIIKARKNIKLSLFVAGMFLPFLFIVFTYRVVLILCMAIGYAIIISEESMLSSAVCKADIFDENERNLPYGNGSLKKVILRATIATAAVVILLQRGFWDVMYEFFLRYQLFSRQSSWRFITIVCILIFVGLYIKAALRFPSAKNFFLAIFSCIYLIVILTTYVIPYSYIRSFLNAKGMWTEIREIALLSLFYVVPFALVMIQINLYEFYARKKSYMITGIAVMLVIICGYITGFVFLAKAAEGGEVPFEERAILELVADTKQGELYVDECPASYSKQLGNAISFTTRDDVAMKTARDATMVLNYNTDNEELFSYGYLMMPISEKHVIYTNDKKVIDGMRAAGYELYSFYCIPRYISNENIVAMNSWLNCVDNEIYINGQNASLGHGPYDALEPGNYVVRYKLHVYHVPASGRVGQIKIASEYGKLSLANMEIPADNPKVASVFVTEKGDDDCKEVKIPLVYDMDDMIIDIPVNISSLSFGTEYLALAYDDAVFSLKEMSITKQKDVCIRQKYHYQPNSRKQRVVYEFVDKYGNPLYSGTDFNSKDYLGFAIPEGLCTYTISYDWFGNRL